MGMKAKPGSILSDGSVIDFLGVAHSKGPCFVPQGLGALPYFDRSCRRARIYDAQGWRVIPAKDWPSMLPTQGVYCIARTGERV